MQRRYLQPEQVYYVRNDNQWFISPDGIGGFWYDSLKELEAQHGPQPTYTTVSDLDD